LAPRVPVEAPRLEARTATRALDRHEPSRLTRRAARPAAALALVLAADAALALGPRWPLGGLLDEPAHAATAALALMCLPPRPRAWRAGYAVASLGVDADHLPLMRRRAEITSATPRPAAHTLAVPALLGAAEALLPARAGALARGAAAGALTHLARDLATGPGVALLAPIDRRQLRLPYGLYAAGLVALAVRAARPRLHAGAIGASIGPGL
jgi:LexA-binding, inner membrane-associated putative hydrolase